MLYNIVETKSHNRYQQNQIGLAGRFSFGFASKSQQPGDFWTRIKPSRLVILLVLIKAAKRMSANRVHPCSHVVYSSFQGYPFSDSQPTFLENFHLAIASSVMQECVVLEKLHHVLTENLTPRSITKKHLVLFKTSVHHQSG